jgi:hypothetical protein
MCGSRTSLSPARYLQVDGRARSTRSTLVPFHFICSPAFQRRPRVEQHLYLTFGSPRPSSAHIDCLVSPSSSTSGRVPTVYGQTCVVAPSFVRAPDYSRCLNIRMTCCSRPPCSLILPLANANANIGVQHAAYTSAMLRMRCLEAHTRGA